ncbi:MAG: hypothetical protein U0T82_04440 [Bacteroidales bacterium]
MEFRTRDKEGGKTSGLIHKIPVIIVFILLVCFIVSQSWLQTFFIQLNRENILLNEKIWPYIIKSVLYFIHISLAFAFLFLVTQRMRYSLLMVAATVLILLVKTIIFRSEDISMEMPMQLPLYIDTILVFFIAGYFLTRHSDSTGK